MSPAAVFDETRREIILVHAVTDDHDATLIWIVKTADQNTIKLQDDLLNSMNRKFCRFGVVRIIDNNDIRAKAGDAALERRGVNAAAGRCHKIFVFSKTLNSCFEKGFIPI